MPYTAQQIATAATMFDGVTDKLSALIYLLNTSMLTANQISAGASLYDGVTDKKSAIIYLLTQGAAVSASTFFNGVGPPVGTPASLGLANIIVDVNGNQFMYFNNQWN